MQRLEVSGAVRPTYGSLGVKRLMHNPFNDVDLDSSVGIETRYGLDGPGIESRWGEIFRTRPERPLGTPSLLYSR